MHARQLSRNNGSYLLLLGLVDRCEYRRYRHGTNISCGELSDDPADFAGIQGTDRPTIVVVAARNYGCVTTDGVDQRVRPIRERANAQRRGGGRKPIPLDGETAETRYSLEPADKVTPEVLFERRWAFTLLERTMAKLRQEYSRLEKLDAFEELQGFLPGGQGSASRAELAAKRGVSAGAIDVAVHRLRQQFGALLRENVAQTVSSEAEVEEETF